MRLFVPFLLCAASAYGGTVTVSGLTEAAVLSAMSSACNGTTSGTVIFPNGTYPFTNSTTVVPGNCTLQAQNVGGAILSGPGQTILTVWSDRVTITGLVFDGGNVHVGTNPTSYFTFTNNTVRNITSTGISTAGLWIDGYMSFATITNNYFFNLWWGGYPNNPFTGRTVAQWDSFGLSAIHVYHGITDTTIDYNRLDEISADGIDFATPTPAENHGSNISISHNEFIRVHRGNLETQTMMNNLVVKDNYLHDPAFPFNNTYGFSLAIDGATGINFLNNTIATNSVAAGDCTYFFPMALEAGGDNYLIQGNVSATINPVGSCGSGTYQGIAQGGDTVNTSSFDIAQDNIYCGSPNITGLWPETPSHNILVDQYNYRNTSSCPAGSNLIASNIVPLFTSANNRSFPTGGNGTWTATVVSNLSIQWVQFFVDSSITPIVTQELSDVNTNFTNDRAWHYNARVDTSTLAAGSHTIKAVATDVSGATANSSTQSFTVGAVSCTITTTSPMAAGATSVAYSQTLAQSACASSTWAITSGSLPTGLSLNTSTGAIAGTPSVAGTSSFTVSYATATPVPLSITIITTPPCSVTTTSPLPAGTAGTGYTQTLAEISCTGSWSVTSGNLPTGLTLDSSTGVIAGIPTTPGVYGFTAAYGAGSAVLSLTIQTPGASLYDNGNTGTYANSGVVSAIPITLTSAPTAGTLYYAATAYSAPTIAAPDGTWTSIDNLVGTGASAADWYRTQRSGDTAGSYTWTQSPSNWGSGNLVEIIGAKNSAPINNHAVANIATVSATWAAPTVTPTVNGTLGIVTVSTGWGTTVSESATGSLGWTLAAMASSQYHSTFTFVQNVPSVGTSPVAFSATLSTADTGVISMALIAPAVANPFTVSCAPIGVGGGTSTCNASQSVTWSVNSGPGTVSPSSGISTTYTQALGIAAASVVGGCMTTPNDSVYNTNISVTALSPNSAAYITNSSHTYPITFGAAWGVNIIDNTYPTSAKQFHYTPNYNTANGFSWNPLNGPAIVESGSMPGFTGYDGGDHHEIVMNHQTCGFQEIYQNNNWNADGAASENARSGWQYSGLRYALPTNGTTDASGQCLECITLRAPEILNHSVNHALRFTTNQGYMDSSKTVWPATGGSGLAGTTLAPYGSRYRLKSSFSTAGFNAESVAILNALKNEGMILADAASYPGINQIQVSPDVQNCALCAAALAQITAAAIPITQFDIVDDSTIIGPLGTAYSQVSTAAAAGNVAIVRAVSGGTVDTSVTLVPVTVGVQGQFAGAQAGAGPITISSWVNGSANQTVTWTIGTCSLGTGNCGTFSGALYTPPASLTANTTASATLIATAAADATQSVTIWLTIYPAGVLRFNSARTTGYTDASSNFWFPDQQLDNSVVSPQTAWSASSWPGTTADTTVFSTFSNTYPNDIRYGPFWTTNGNYKVTYYFGFGYAACSGTYNGNNGGPYSLVTQGQVQSRFDFGMFSGYLCRVPIQVSVPATVTNNVLEFGVYSSFHAGSSFEGLSVLADNAAQISGVSFATNGTPAHWCIDGQGIATDTDAVCAQTVPTGVTSGGPQVLIPAIGPTTAGQFNCIAGGVGVSDQSYTAGTLQLAVTSWYAGTASPTWSIVSGPGAISATGCYTAPSTPASSTTVTVEATDGGSNTARAAILLLGTGTVIQ